MAECPRPGEVVPLRKIPFPSPDVMADPHAYYARGRKEAPVLKVPDRQEYLLFRWSDVEFVLRNDGKLFSSRANINHDGPIVVDVGAARHIAADDPPDHSANRRLLMRVFSPATQRAHEPTVRDITTRVIRRFYDRGEVEIVSEFAYPIPTLVMCSIMGLPQEGGTFETIRRWASVVDERLTVEDGRQMVRYMASLVEQRWLEPAEDLLSRLIQLQLERDGRFDPDLCATLGLELLAGGVVTTGQVITSAVRRLVENPMLAAEVVADPNLVPILVEEVLRLDGPVQHRQRFAIEDVEMGGVTIPAGARIRIMTASANRDEAGFQHAHDFAVGRNDGKKHVAFGRGIHHCLGAPLARMEVSVALDELLGRVSRLRPAEDADSDVAPRDRLSFYSPTTLRLCFDPREAP